jgi:iron complex outermembrane receptor protein
MGRIPRCLPLAFSAGISLPNLSFAESEAPLEFQPSHSTFTVQDAQWVPGSVTVITQDEIEATFRRTLEDLEGYVPGLVIDPISGAPQGAAIGLRGIHSNNPSLGFEPAVAVTVDGVYVGTHDAQNQHLFDFETVEVARGPQGMFTAAPAEGGAIHIRRTKPTGELGVKTRLSAGDFNGNNVDAVINFPLLEDLAAKVTIAHQNRDGADLKNRVVDRREYGIDRVTYGLSLLWQASNNWSAQYSIELDRDDSETPGLLNLSQPNDLICVPDPSDPDTLANCASNQDLRLPESGNQQRFLQNFSSDREFEADTQIVTLNGQAFGHEIESVTGFRRTKTTSNQDLDGTSVDRLSITEDRDYDQVSTELTARGKYSDNLSYSIGFSYLNSEYDLFRRSFFVLDTLATAELVNGLDANQARVVESEQTSKTLSVFGHGVYRWDDQWTFDFGLRSLVIEKDFDQTVFGLARGGVAAADLELTGNKEFEEVAGTVGFSYKVDDLAMVYGRFSADHTPGGFNDLAINLNSAANYDTSTTKGVELGLKSHWLDDQLRLNFAFYNNYQDDKVEYVPRRFDNTTIGFVYDNVGEVEVRGFDLEFEYAPLDNLYIRGSWGHMNSDYVRYEVQDLTLNPSPILDEVRDPLRAPANIVFLSGKYAIPYRSGFVNIYLGYTYFDEYRSDLEIPVGLVRTFSTWDASIEYQWQDYTVRLFSQNINDKRFIMNAQRTFDAQYVFLPQTATGVQGIATVADVNRPRYTGIEVVWQPNLDFLDN